MPKYNEKQIDEYKIIPSPSPNDKSRNFLYKFGIKKLYFINERIQLKLKIILDKSFEKREFPTISVWAEYPHNYKSKEERIPVTDKDGKFLVDEFLFEPKHEISGTGEVSVFAKRTYGDGEEERFTLFDTKVTSVDEYFLERKFPIILVIVSVVLSVIATVVVMSFWLLHNSNSPTKRAVDFGGLCVLN